MDDQQKKDRALAARLVEIGVSRPYASQLSRGERSPSLSLAIQIEDQLGIPVRFWKEREIAA